MDRRNFIGRAAVVSSLSVLTVGCASQTQSDGRVSVPFYLVDAFTDTAFAGNPAPVVLLHQWLPDVTMQALAREMNMSEVAFIVRKAPDEWDIRWFTPVREVPLNGHATLAAASIIFETIEPSLKVARFSAKGGKLTVQRDGTAYLMSFPADPVPRQVAVPEDAEADLGVKPSEYWVNARNIAVFRNAAEVRAVVSKITKETKWTDGRHLMITAPGDGSIDYVLRYFVPILNIPEDPVSGVVHCTLAPFWAKRLGKSQFNVTQLSARGGSARTGLESDGRVLIGGPCVRYMNGSLLL